VKLLKDSVVLSQNSVTVLGVQAEKSNSVGSVSLSVLVLVVQTVHEELKKLLGVLGNGGFHKLDRVCDNTDGGGTLTGVGGGGVFDDVLGDNLPDVSVLRSESNGESEENIHGAVDQEPVILGALLEVGDLLVVNVVQLGRVLLGEDENDLGGELEDGVSVGVGEDGGSAELEGLGDVLEDVRDGGSAYS
jgi:hypothetical protein